MKVAQFSYDLPEELVAQSPLPERGESRMLLVGKAGGDLQDSSFSMLPELVTGEELIVVNNTRVIPARLLGRRRGLKSEPISGESRIRSEHLSAEIEFLLLRRVQEDETWEVLARPGRKVRVGEVVVFGGGVLTAEVLDRGSYGQRTVRFSCEGDFRSVLDRVGHVPLPPYIHRSDRESDRERYQTVFARRWGAVAAPTAALHFTGEMVDVLRQRGCEIAELTLEVGYGTFQPIHSETVEGHTLHSERFDIPAATATAVNRSRADERPVLAVGTTVVRALESATDEGGKVRAGSGETDLFIYPGYEFRVVNQLLTNFHLPESSLLMLVCALAGGENVLAAYRHAVEQRYRFYSYGDCMLIR